ncbi:VanZ family protein [Myxococcota bacterium]|nr:VanZ family protein [Myxococcota bacterium]MBU1410818.1 VanZ family protein [Myxococcota bacterium]MBU1510660.1 VanZ family protein [Myxococcota bacterium]PKN24080.1 MAG: hypothetical protein CVU65_12775 [Deltaproteobacteria bacterium HGW-Deltaproteobacteria-22]
MNSLLRLLRQHFPAAILWVQVPPAIAVVCFFGVEHLYYRMFPVLLFAGGLVFLLPGFVSGRARFLPPVYYYGLISLLSATSTRTSRPVAGFVFHPAEYFFLAVLLSWALSRSPKRSSMRAVGLMLALCALAGGLDEWHQSFVPGRVADPVDWILDLSGALAGSLFFLALPRALRAPAAPPATCGERNPP